MMIKKIKLIFVVLFFNLSVQAQEKFVFTYSPDSSALSIIIDKGGYIDTVKKSINIDIKDKWFYKKTKYASVHFRGAYYYDRPNNDTLGKSKVKFVVFGKTYTETMITNKEFFLSYKRPIKRIIRRPKIKIYTKSIKGNNWKFHVDSVDISFIPN